MMIMLSLTLSNPRDTKGTLSFKFVVKFSPGRRRARLHQGKLELDWLMLASKRRRRFESLD
jgi:hypothetical protein